MEIKNARQFCISFLKVFYLPPSLSPSLHHTYKHALTHTLWHKCTSTHTHSQYMLAYARTPTRTPAHTHAHTHTHPPTRTHTHTHTCTHWNPLYNLFLPVSPVFIFLLHGYQIWFVLLLFFPPKGLLLFLKAAEGLWDKLFSSRPNPFSNVPLPPFEWLSSSSTSEAPSQD